MRHFLDGGNPPSLVRENVVWLPNQSSERGSPAGHESKEKATMNKPEGAPRFAKDQDHRANSRLEKVGAG